MKKLCLLFQDISSPETFLKKLFLLYTILHPILTSQRLKTKENIKSFFLTCKRNIINPDSGPGRYRVFKDGVQIEICRGSVEENESGNCLVQAIKTINIKVIYMIAEAWN
jgi:hypothetical protein